MWQENTPLSATFELEATESFDTIMIINGVGRPEHKINGIKVKMKTSKTNNYWLLFKEVRVKNDSGAQVAPDGAIVLSRGQEYLQIKFKPVQEGQFFKE